jgi:oligopeptidase A
MQEKWVYDKKTFDSFAKHWQTNQPVPPELFERIKASRTYRKGEERVTLGAACKNA